MIIVHMIYYSINDTLHMSIGDNTTVPNIYIPLSTWHHQYSLLYTTVNQQILAAIKFGVSQTKVIWR